MIVLTSFTSIESPGGVPRWNRDFIRKFTSAKHYSWDYVVERYGDAAITEWEKARVLNALLLKDGKIRGDDIVITDGFWGLGLEKHDNVVSVCHGNWSHRSHEEIRAGLTPLFPHHHAVQVKYRKDLTKRNGRLVAVSDFVRDDMALQWGFFSYTINNAIDLDTFKNHDKTPRKRPLIIHGATTDSKGIDHVLHVKKHIDADVRLLDEEYNIRDRSFSKEFIIADADLVLVPSTYEGNSYFVLEALASDVPVVAYDTGLLYRYNIEKDMGLDISIGEVSSRNARSKEKTLEMTCAALDRLSSYSPRKWVKSFSINNFWNQWQEYLSVNFGYTEEHRG